MSCPRSASILLFLLVPICTGSVYFLPWPNESGSLRSFSAARRASLSVAPRLSASWYCSSRCCESSSTLSASRVGGRFNFGSRRRTSARKSGMLNSGDATDRGDELAPTFPLPREHFPACRREAVVAPSTLSGFFDPAATNPAAFFESVEKWIERSDVEAQGAARA